MAVGLLTTAGAVSSMDRDTGMGFRLRCGLADWSVYTFATAYVEALPRSQLVVRPKTLRSCLQGKDLCIYGKF
jgi:hypothetical protein